MLYVCSKSEWSNKCLTICQELIDPNLNDSIAKTNFGERLQAVKDDGYLYKNICHLLRGTGSGRKMMELLTNVLRAVEQMETYNAGQIRSDVKVFWSAVKDEGVDVGTTDIDELRKFCVALLDACNFTCYEMRGRK